MGLFRDVFGQHITAGRFFLSRFKRKGGDAGEFTYDYELQGGTYAVQTSIETFPVSTAAEN